MTRKRRNAWACARLIGALGALILATGLGAGEAAAQRLTPEERAAILASETPEEKEERETRRKCAAAACGTLRNKRPDTGELTCPIRKTWRKEVLNKIMGRAKVSWPWGNARCAGDLKIDRAVLVQAVSGADYEAKFDKHELTCQIDLEKEKYTMKVQLTPKVTFKDGKAVKAAMQWGDIDAPTLAKTALWSITAADNQLGVLQGTIVEDINEFITAKCDEVKPEWEGK
ncbi:MAG: hypothetical protein NW223_10225 [Hyphomicrobiaceae bacterium]|nr:hypothetical protein [Hyphomicrobiaceae bacterium]